MTLDMSRGKVYWQDKGNASVFYNDSWVDQTGGNIRRANLDGSNVEGLNFSAQNFVLDVIRNDMYFADWYPGYDHPPLGGIGRMNLDGLTEDDYYSDLHHIDQTDIALDLEHGQIYWTNAHDGTIYRADLKVTTTEQLITGLDIGEHGRGADNLIVHHPVLTAVSMPNAPSAPGTSSLQQNVPNPFNSTTRIPYHLASTGPVRLEIYNTLGQLLHTLVDKVQPAGFYHASWDARDRQGSVVSAGVYLARLGYPGGMQTRRLLFLK